MGLTLVEMLSVCQAERYCVQFAFTRARPLDESALHCPYFEATGPIRCQNSLNSRLSKEADALVTLPSRIWKNHAYVLT
jgi:hypothetical protein